MIGLLLQRVNVIIIKFMVKQFSPTLRINDKSLLKQRASENSPVLIMLNVMLIKFQFLLIKLPKIICP